VATARLLGQSMGAGLVALCFHLASQMHAPRAALWLGCAFALAGSRAASGGSRRARSPGCS